MARNKDIGKKKMQNKLPYTIIPVHAVKTMKTMETV